MKRYIFGASKITENKVYDYLKKNRRDNGQLSDATLREMAAELFDAIHEEEMLSGEYYSSIEDADIGELLDASSGSLYDNGQIWFGFVDEDDFEDYEEEEEEVVESLHDVIDPSDVKGITLLSVEEAETVPWNIRKISGDISRFWWLRDPSPFAEYFPEAKSNFYFAAIVFFDGRIWPKGYYVNDSTAVARPALIVPNLSSYNLPDYSKVSLFGRDWYAINDLNYLFLDGDLGDHVFNKTYEQGNNYKTSDIKQYIEDWLRGQLK